MKLRMVDVTLSEGELASGVGFTVDQKVEVAKWLDRAGVGVIEVGRPSVSEEDFEAARAVAEEGLRAEVAAVAWPLSEDLEAAIDSGADRVAVRYPAWRRAAEKLGFDLAKLRGLVEEGVARGLKVTVVAEWATHSSLSEIAELALAAEGAEALCLADTASLLTPSEAFSLVKEAAGLKGGLRLEARFHDALGLAVANSLAAVEAGVEGLHCSVNGLGEGPGLASISEVAVAIRKRLGVATLDLPSLRKLAELVEKFSGVLAKSQGSMMGDGSVSVRSWPRADLALEGLPSLWPVGLSEVGRRVEVEASKHCSPKAIAHRARQAGYELSEEAAQKVLRSLRTGPARRVVGDADLASFIEEVVGARPAPAQRRVEAVVMVQCVSNVHTSTVARRVLSVEGVEGVEEISGEFDIEVRLSADNLVQLNERLDRIRSIKGVAGTRTIFILKKYSPGARGS
ncbi:MAG: Lrp/AsnC ligand binding domain-containing protein [Candidatus Nezhaarchaeota archaeon]|nr:Lrp/AsnC ligand binding domain-containing protein [Candidatus Nezhaarchaeota archaeon]